VTGLHKALHEAGLSKPGSASGALNLKGHKSHHEAYLHELVEQRSGILGTSYVPFRVAIEGGAVGLVDTPVHFPWDILHELYSGDVFDTAIFGHGVSGCAREQLCLEFWDALDHSTQSHHMNDDPDCRPLRSHTVPLFYHSDGGEVFNGGKYEIFHCCSAFSRDVDPRDAKFYQAMLEQYQLVQETDEDYARYVETCRPILESGMFPSQDQLPPDWRLDEARQKLAGKPFAGGWRFTFGGWQGDLMDRVRTHQFARNYLCNFMCERCYCSKVLPECSPFDFREGAMWLRMLVTHVAYMACNDPHSPWTCVRSWTMFRNRDDLLHTMWLGFAKDIIAQCIFDLAWILAGRSRTLPPLLR
jgi:hypothetical protein